MSTKIWIDDKMYLVDEPVREYVDELQAKLATANKNYKNARLGAENSIYNLLSHITNNKYGPWSVSRKDDIVPQWFDALEKEVKQLQAENKRLREFTENWDGHHSECECLDEGSPRTDYCTCGYKEAREQALKGECKQNVFMAREERIAAFHKAHGEKWSEEREQWIPEGE